jgi:hypothetical protein
MTKFGARDDLMLFEGARVLNVDVNTEMLFSVKDFNLLNNTFAL